MRELLSTEGGSKTTAQLNASVSPFLGKLFRVAFSAAVVLLGLAFAKYRLATRFRFYDDEGYLLLSLAHYLSGHSLYRDTYSQYGPFYFFAQQACFRFLRLPITHDAGRLVTLLYWAASALLAGRFVQKISHSALLGSSATISCVLLGAVLGDEPGHPQQLVLLLFMLASCFSLAGASVPNRRSLLALGAIGGALMFTKINIGVFYAAALAQTVFCLLPRSRVRTVGLSLMFAYALSVPLLLMHSNLKGWAGSYCLLAIFCGSSTFMCGSLLQSRSRLPVRSTLYAMAGLLVATAFIVMTALLINIPARVLLQSVFLDPLKQPMMFFTPLSISRAELISAFVLTGCFGAIRLFRERLRAHTPSLGALRFAFGLAVILISLWVPMRPDGRFVQVAWIIPLLPLSLMPLTIESVELPDLFPRLFIANLAATQFLQAYPVAGGQLSIGAMPLLLWGFICVADGADGLHSLLDSASRSVVELYPKYGFTSVLIVTAALLVMFSSGFRPRGYLYPPSHLHGSASLHLPPGEEGRYRFLADSVHANCSVLFTMPGMGSFNLWSGVPSPNGWNLTAWTKTFSVEREQQILDILQSNPRACVIYNKELAHFWGSSTDELAALPLPAYILFNMPKIAVTDGYEIRIHPARKMPWIDVRTRTNVIIPHARGFGVNAVS